ncbi:MAG: YceI family protein [Ignavibacteriae bacterium]|nr:YceI family protein [Ignavibacteriota bacterium]NOG98948.1 YceI family protein [Ignavibacteriota bacterium]
MKKFLLILILVSSIIFADEWQVEKTTKNSVQFISSTTLLDFEGNTTNIDGYLYWEGESMFADKNELYFEVDLNSVKTGNAKRDRDMREEVLETDKFPTTHFKGTIIKFEEKEAGIYSVITKGLFSLHGNKMEMEIPGDITIKDGAMNIQTHFSVFLNEFDIEAPSLLAFIKVAEEIKLNLKFYLKKAE